MTADAPVLTFRPLAEADLDLVHRWRNEPHVARWFRDGATIEQIRDKYLPRIEGREPIACHLILLDGSPIGLIQTYRIGDFPEYAAVVGVPEGCAGLDRSSARRNTWAAVWVPRSSIASWT